MANKEAVHEVTPLESWMDAVTHLLSDLAVRRRTHGGDHELAMEDVESIRGQLLDAHDKIVADRSPKEEPKKPAAKKAEKEDKE